MREICYFSYCWENPSELMQYLKEEIENKSDGRIQVIYDKKSFLIAENFIQNEKKVLECDSVVVFLSPEYNKIINDKIENRGVFREYNYIRSMLNSDSTNSASVIPVMIKGNINTSVTDELKTSIIADLSGNVLEKKKGAFIINTHYKSVVTNLVSLIIRETDLANKRKDYKFESEEEIYEYLFISTASNGKLPRECMYKTDAYSGIISQRIMFIIGRKGSGKTTFFDVLQKYDVDYFESNYKILRPISAEYINLEYLYSVVKKYPDDNKLFPISILLNVFWEIYIYLCCIYIVCLEEELCKILDDRRVIFHKVTNKIKKKFNVKKLDNKECQKAIFIESVSILDDFFTSHLLNYATEESFYASLVANFSIKNIMENYLDKSLYNSFINALLKCEKKILIALDKFDTLSEDFRQKTKPYMLNSSAEIFEFGYDRGDFERIFYRSMINAITTLRNDDQTLIKKTGFCIIIPQDRMEQIKEVDRDYSKINFASLSWDAIELLEIVVMRLEYINNKKTEKKYDILSRYYNIMRECLPSIPIELEIEVEGIIKKIDLFQYILRISFWRPRDILKYYAVLYSLNLNTEKQNHALIDSDTIKMQLNSCADSIIEGEFIKEYEKVIYNIDNIISAFYEKNIVLSYGELYDYLSHIPFQSSSAIDYENITQKIKMLYEVGIIGLLFNADATKQKGIGHEFCFIFNEGLRPVEIITKFGLEETRVRFVVNPILAKKLSLKFNIKNIIGDFGWDYLKENHSRKMTIKRI